SRSIVTGISVILATLLVAAMRYVQTGTYMVNFQAALKFSTGQWQVAANGFLVEQDLEHYLELPHETWEALHAIPELSVTRRIQTGGLLAYGERSVFAQIWGVDEIKE